MCLILFAHNAHPDYPLIVAANRDEFYARPTEPAQFWSEHATLLAGRDLQAGGTWLGITQSGRFAAITNYREEKNSDPLHSRGQLTLDFLLSEQSPGEYLQHVQDQAWKYNGFNLLVGQPGALSYFSNRADPPRALPDGIFALGNGTLQDSWHKTYRGKADLSRAIAGKVDPGTLLQLMVDEIRSNDEQLPDTGVGLELERVLSARFIRTEHYGTRSTAVLLVNQSRQVRFVEQNYLAIGIDGAPHRFEFKTSK